MSALDGLVPEFRAKVEAALAYAQTQGLTMHPYFGVRDPITQGKLWRQSRSRATIGAKIAHLRDTGGAFLAWCLEQAGPQEGRPVTGAAPGESWHQYAEAVDCYVVGADGEPDWDDVAEYQAWARFGQAQGLTSGVGWGDNDHLQLRAIEPPAAFGGVPGMDAAMRKIWADKLGYSP